MKNKKDYSILISILLFLIFVGIDILIIQSVNSPSCISTSTTTECSGLQHSLEIYPARYQPTTDSAWIPSNMTIVDSSGSYIYQILTSPYQVYIDNKTNNQIEIYQDSDYIKIKTGSRIINVNKNNVTYNISNNQINATLTYSFGLNRIDKLITIYNITSNLTSDYNYVENYTQNNHSGDFQIQKTINYWDGNNVNNIIPISVDSATSNITINRNIINQAKFPIYIDPSLIITSGTTILGGNQTYDYVIIYPGAVLQVNNSIGYLNITATLNISNYGTINGGSNVVNLGLGGSGSDSAGTGQSHADSGGAGGGHNQTGGAGGDASASSCSSSGGIAGSSYGNFSDRQSLTQGSAGGSGATYSGTGGSGGAGSGSIKLSAPLIYSNSTININGAGGGSGSGGTWHVSAGGGGGSAGTLILEGTNINITSSTITANGGNGGSGSTAGACDGSNNGGAGGGGGGAGGIIKIFFEQNLYNSSALLTRWFGSGGGGSAMCGGSGNSGNNGLNGSIYISKQVLSFNSPPNVIFNATVPALPSLGDSNVYINLTANDTDGDYFVAVYFNVTMPNGTMLVDNANGTDIGGNSTSQYGQEWHSPLFNIPNNINSNGNWNWTYTIVSNATTNQNTTIIGQFPIGDSTPPNVQIIYPTNNTIYYNNFSDNLTFSVSDNLGVSSCWYSLNGGTNNYTINSPTTNNSFNFGYANDTNYNITLWCNDTSNNLNSSRIYNLSILYDTTLPTLQIIAPSSSISTSSFLVNLSAIDIGTINNCYFNITTLGGGIIYVNTLLSNSAGTNFYTSSPTTSDGTYNLNAWCNDVTGNTNSTNLTITVSTSIVVPPGGGGGGSSTPTNANWTMESTPGSASYEKSLPLGTSITLSASFRNLGESSREISLSCVDIEGEICRYITFKEDKFTLPVLKDVETKEYFTISIPSDFVSGSYKFNIVANDNYGSVKSISVYLDLGNQNIIVSTISKLGLNTRWNFPYLLIFIPLLVILLIISTKFISKKVPFRGLYIFLIVLGVPFIVIYFI